MDKLKIVEAIFLITVCVAIFAVGYILSQSQGLEQVNYDVSVTKSMYHFPQWNVTLTFHQNISVPLYSAKLFHGGQLVTYADWKAIIFNKNDNLTFNYNMDVHIASGENFTIWLYFDSNKYMTLNLILPTEVD